MKQTIAILAVLTLTLVGCGSDDVDSQRPTHVPNVIQGENLRTDVIDLEDDVYPDVLRFCDGTTLYVVTRIERLRSSAGGGGIALLADGCVDGVIK